MPLPPQDLALVDLWLAFKLANEGKSEETVRKYRGYMHKLLEFMHGKPVIEASLDDLEKFSGVYMHEKGLSPRSRHALVAAVRGFFSWLIRVGKLQKDPAFFLPYPKSGKKLPIPMALSNAEALLMQPDISTLAGARDAAIFAIMIGCGVRVSGLISLNQDDLSFFFEGDTERMSIRVTEKGGKQRVVPAPHEARLLVHVYLGHHELGNIDRTLPTGDQVLFISLRNRRVSPDKFHGEARRLSSRSINNLIKKHGTVAGIPANQCHPHALRHLFGAEMAENDASLLVQQTLMGHEDPRSTKIYAHLATKKLAKTIDRSGPLGRVRTPVSDLLQRI